MMENLAIAPSTRGLRVIGALLAGALAVAGFVDTRPAPAPRPCAISSTDYRGHAVMRRRTHDVNPRYLTRTLCVRDSAGRIACAK